MSNLAFPLHAFRAHFPFLRAHPEVAYLDSAATTLKPQILIDATRDFYASAGSVHRSQYDEYNTISYEFAREQMCRLLHAENKDCIIWTSGATESINLVANGLTQRLFAGDEIVISFAEHHANFVPWQQLAKRCDAKLRILPVNEKGEIEPAVLINALNHKTKIVALNWVSNVTGTTQPLTRLIPLIRQHSKALVLVDGAQAINHLSVNLQTLDCDFFAFSAHKMYGPTGLGVLAGKKSALELLSPLIFGGKMVEKVSEMGTDFAPLPYRLEAGTPNIAGVLGFSAVLTWLTQWDLEAAEKHTLALAEKTRQRLMRYENCEVFTAPNASCTLSFSFKHIANFDLATLLTEQNIALRAGQHCAQPYLQHLGQNTTLRLSFAPYNQEKDVEHFFHALDNALDLLC